MAASISVTWMTRNFSASGSVKQISRLWISSSSVPILDAKERVSWTVWLRISLTICVMWPGDVLLTSNSAQPSTAWSSIQAIMTASLTMASLSKIYLRLLWSLRKKKFLKLYLPLK